MINLFEIWRISNREVIHITCKHTHLKFKFQGEKIEEKNKNFTVSNDSFFKCAFSST